VTGFIMYRYAMIDFQSGGYAAAPIFLLLAQKKDGVDSTS